jgi:hypothetical protein
MIETGGAELLLLVALPAFVIGVAGGFARRTGASVLITVLTYAVGGVFYWRSQQFADGGNGFQLLVNAIAVWFILLSQILALPSLVLGFLAARFLSRRRA